MDKLTRTLLAANTRLRAALEAMANGWETQRHFLNAEGIDVPKPGSLTDYIALAELICRTALNIPVAAPGAPRDDVELMTHMLSRFGQHQKQCNFLLTTCPRAGLKLGECDCGWATFNMSLTAVTPHEEMLPPEVEDAPSN